MKKNPLKQLPSFRQSVWLDYIRRDMIKNGSLKRLIEEDDLRGMTSNPAIFEKAIAENEDYDMDIASMAQTKKNALEIYEALSQQDVMMAADEFRPVYEKTQGLDGYVSLEVNPHLANDTRGTIAEARRLWVALGRHNVLIKVPGTNAGLKAIEELVSEGLNINITLLFGLPRYRQVAEAYIKGLEARVAQGKSIKYVTSVASFFVSRIDTLVDPLLDKIIAQGGNNRKTARKLKGQVAVASAKMAYQIYKEIFGSERFKKLSQSGAHIQRLLWASTGTKNPEYSDVKYVESLIGPDTVNTLPLDTLNAFRSHGLLKPSLESELEKAGEVFKQLTELGLNIDKLTQELEDTSIEKFTQPFDHLLEVLVKKSVMTPDKLKVVQV